MPERVAVILEQALGRMEDLTDAIEKIHDDRRRDRLIMWIALGAGATAVVAVAVVGLLFVRLHHVIDDINDSRAENRLALCQTLNSAAEVARRDNHAMIAIIPQIDPDLTEPAQVLDGTQSRPGTVDQDCNVDEALTSADYIAGLAPTEGLPIPVG